MNAKAGNVDQEEGYCKQSDPAEIYGAGLMILGAQQGWGRRRRAWACKKTPRKDNGDVACGSSEEDEEERQHRIRHALKLVPRRAKRW